MKRVLLGLGLIALLSPSFARADEGELYVLLSGGPVLFSVKEPSTGASASPVSYFGEVTGYYGLSNTVHVGAALHYSGLGGTGFPGGVTTLPDGSTPHGTLYEDISTFAAEGVLAYRVDTAMHLAPVFRLDVGANLVRTSNVGLVPDNTTLSLPQPSTQKIALTARLLASLEYRFADSWVAQLGVAFRANPNTSVRTQWEVPFTIGHIF